MQKHGGKGKGSELLSPEASGRGVEVVCDGRRAGRWAGDLCVSLPPVGSSQGGERGRARRDRPSLGFRMPSSLPSGLSALCPRTVTGSSSRAPGAQLLRSSSSASPPVPVRTRRAARGGNPVQTRLDPGGASWACVTSREQPGRNSPWKELEPGTHHPSASPSVSGPPSSLLCGLGVGGTQPGSFQAHTCWAS